MDPAAIPSNGFPSKVGDFLKSGEFSDIVIQCGQSTYNLHRMVLCSQSKFFRNACTNGFSETHSKHIELHEDDPLMVKLMFDYLYTGLYNDDEYETINPAVTNAHMYVLGDKYEIPELCTTASKRFTEQIKTSNDGALFVELVPLIYSNTVESDLTIRKPIIEAVAKNFTELLKQPDATEMLAATGDFSKDLLLYKHQGAHSDKLKECSTCGWQLDEARVGYATNGCACKWGAAQTWAAKNCLPEVLCKCNNCFCCFKVFTEPGHSTQIRCPKCGSHYFISKVTPKT